MDKERELKRISLLIGEDQYQEVSKRGLNLSWLIRDLMDQYFDEKKISLSVSDETLKLYQKVAAATGGLDKDFEQFFKTALHEFLKSKIQNMQNFEKKEFRKS